jgi:hypothetical protein
VGPFRTQGNTNVCIMKKITKPSKTPAPATKSAAPAPAPKAAAAAPTPKPAAPAPAVKSTVAPKVTKTAAPAAVIAKAGQSRVTIIAAVDVGFGNTLYVRGDAPALSWDKGVALGNIGDAKWEIVLSGLGKPFEFKFLVNDTAWSTGENFCAGPADTLTLTPSF